MRGEPHRSPGWAGGSELDAVLDAFAVAIRKKQARLSTYSEVADKVWLFLIDDTGFAGAFSDLLSRAGARREIAEICANTGFDAIFLYQFARGRPLRVHPRILRS